MQNLAKTVSLPKESLCICGSGKNFGDCCSHKNHTYESLLIDETGTTIVYDQSEIVNSVKSLNNFIETRVNNIPTRLYAEEALRKLKKLFQKFGEALKPMSSCTSCKAGCSHCCHLLVLTSQLEAELINQYITTHFSQIEIEEFKSKIEKHKELLNNILPLKDGSFSKESTQAYLSSNISCAFLDNNNCCSIYEVRPFICRKYLVFNSPELCKNPFSKTNQYYAGYHTTVKDTIIKLNQLTYGHTYRYKHLLSWFTN